MLPCRSPRKLSIAFTFGLLASCGVGAGSLKECDPGDTFLLQHSIQVHDDVQAPMSSPPLASSVASPDEKNLSVGGIIATLDSNNSHSVPVTAAARAVQSLSSKAVYGVGLVSDQVDKLVSTAQKDRDTLATGIKKNIEEHPDWKLQERLLHFEALADEALGSFLREWGDLKGMIVSFTTTLAEILGALGSPDLEVQITTVLASALDHADSFTHLLVTASEAIVGISSIPAEEAKSRVHQMGVALRSGVEQVDQFVESFEEAFQMISFGLGVVTNTLPLPDTDVPDVGAGNALHEARSLQSVEPAPSATRTPLSRHNFDSQLKIILRVVDAVQVLQGGLTEAVEALGLHIDSPLRGATSRALPWCIAGSVLVHSARGL